MATENKGKCVSIDASGDLSSSQYRFMSVNSSGQIAATGDGAEADGVLQDKPAAAGRPGEVMVGIGITKVEAGGACTAGGNAASDASGRAVNPVTGDAVLGVFMEAATTAGEVISLLFKPKTGTSS